MLTWRVGGWSERTLPLATVLLTPWAMFQGAADEVIDRAKEEGDDDLLTQGGNALEMAIISGSKRFIRSPSCQKVIGESAQILVGMSRHELDVRDRGYLVRTYRLLCLEC